MTIENLSKKFLKKLQLFLRNMVLRVRRTRNLVASFLIILWFRLKKHIRTILMGSCRL